MTRINRRYIHAECMAGKMREILCGYEFSILSSKNLWWK